jgi:F-type H+-transporting ATPase subunit gamma
MPSLKDLRNRITSVKSTQKITKAMKMVAAAKLRKAQENAEKSRLYSEKMNEIITNLKSSITDKSSAPRLLIGNNDNKRFLCVIMTADRGLCGGFNSNICKKSKEYINNLLKENKEVKIITVGSKSFDQMKRNYGNYIIEKLTFKNQREIKVTDAQKISNKIISMFHKNEFDVCTIFYSKFKSVISQEPIEQQIIPVKNNNNDKITNDQNYEYEPDQEEILDSLLPKNITTQIFKGLLENAASEQGARMSAMDNATRNAGDLIEKLTINYNRSRQAVITKELIEIISGAETL